jgi:hypothetical protein
MKQKNGGQDTRLFSHDEIDDFDLSPLPLFGHAVSRPASGM